MDIRSADQRDQVERDLPGVGDGVERDHRDVATPNGTVVTQAGHCPPPSPAAS